MISNRTVIFLIIQIFNVQHFQSYFLFACTWSLGASVDSKGRKHFDILFKELMTDGLSLENKRRYRILHMVDAPSKPLVTPLPDGGSVYEYRFVSEVNFLYSKTYLLNMPISLPIFSMCFLKCQVTSNNV